MAIITEARISREYGLPQEFLNQMAYPQLENGHVEIANEIMEKLCSYRIPGAQRQVLDAIMRKTWGWNKKADTISLSQFMELTRLDKSNIIRSLKALQVHNVINHDNGVYSIQKNYDHWLPYEYSQGGKRTVVSHDNEIVNHDNVISHDNDLIVKQQNVVNHDNGQPLSARQ
jgi:phage replication O-like protein O